MYSEYAGFHDIYPNLIWLQPIQSCLQEYNNIILIEYKPKNDK